MDQGFPVLSVVGWVPLVGQIMGELIFWSHNDKLVGW